MKLLLLPWLSGIMAGESWVNHQKPPTACVDENHVETKFHLTQAYISLPISEGVEFKVRDHEDQEHGISDGMFRYESIQDEDDGVVKLYMYSRQNLDREEQETYRFAVDLYDSQGNIVTPAPVWYSTINVKDRNDHAPTIDKKSEIHTMEENAKPGLELPLKSPLNEQNGRLVIVDDDKDGSSSMDFNVEVTDVRVYDRNDDQTVLDGVDYFTFADTSSPKKKKIIYNRKIDNISTYKKAELTLTISDCASGCKSGCFKNADSPLKTENIKILIHILDVNTHAPELKAPVEQFLMNENTLRDEKVGMAITATDDDVDLINQLTTFHVVQCSIDSNPTSGCSYFSMSQEPMPCNSIETCKDADLIIDQINRAHLITTEVPIDYEQIKLRDGERRYVSVTIVGENSEALLPLESDPLTIKVYVNDVNERPELIENSNLIVMENMPTQTPVGQIRARDPENSKIEFIVDSPHFEVNSKGEIKTKDVLDREAEYTSKEDETGRRTISLLVTAREIDENPNLESHMMYTIVIDDENDNGPKTGRITQTNPEPIVDDNLYACNIMADDQKLTTLGIVDPDRDYKSTQHKGGSNQELYKFDPIMDADLPFGVEIRQDRITHEWGLYSVEDNVEWPSNVGYPIQITGKDSNIEETVTTSQLILNICACNASVQEYPTCSDSIIGPQTAAMDWWIWLIIAIAILSLVIVGLIVGRTRTQKHQILDETNPFDDEDDLKATLIEYNTEGGVPIEKGDWYRKPREDIGEEVVVMPHYGHVQAQKPILPSSMANANFWNEAKTNADADPTAPPHDSLRKFNYEGENSDCELDSICSDDMEEPDWRIDQLDREFKNIGNLFKGAEAEQDDLYDDDDQYSMHD